ncbi:MAG: DUF11 domain-containing protein [candidate division KSB1 bacterium]|nr:DUF11 domain-containing protein [candidate division KSB1 bacterium]MDZ7273003.1 DUF11 domain-containing protein [candidate division KSB1 bacterium]MDZ7285106.1 DUF11 domain-containing protein [candidate division KSB1 bacterium]MDZ7298138.1 DUF11 domain-containing protein [candidate division KSB1 bacterium]MDZ7308803.1 DUF11 domain-containing protein [candidate division KSB1 bacterium]
MICLPASPVWPQAKHPPGLTAIAYTFRVDKERPAHTDSLIYTIRIWNDPLQADTLAGVEAEFFLPTFANGRFALQLSTFRYAGPYPVVVDATAGKITWQIGDLVRRRPPQSSDTATVVFSFHIAAVAEFSLNCGENPLTATARVSFRNGEGRRIYPGTPRAAESTLVLTPDLVAENLGVPAEPQRRGGLLRVRYDYANRGNVARAATLCLRLPAGLTADSVRVVPDSITITPAGADSICLALGVIAAGVSQSVTLRLPLPPDLPGDLDSLCLAGTLLTDCDRNPDNNFFRNTCAGIAPLDLLALAKQVVPQRARVGDTLTFTLTVRNLDPRLQAWHLAIVDTLAAGLQWLSADPPFHFANQIVTWQRPELMAGGTWTVHLTARLTEDWLRRQSGNPCAPATLHNAAVVTSTSAQGAASPESPLHLRNNRSTAAVVVEPPADLLEIFTTLDTLRHTGPAALLPGDTLRFTLHYRNRSGQITATATVIDSLPDPAFLQLLAPLPAGFLHDAAGNRLLRTDLRLPPAAHDSASFLLRFQPAGRACENLVVYNRARIHEATQLDCDLANNTSTTAVTLTGHRNLLQLTVPASAAADPGEEILFTVHYQNLSDISATGVIIQANLAAALQVTAISDSGQLNALRLTWQLGTLAPHTGGSVFWRARVRDTLRCEAEQIPLVSSIMAEVEDCVPEDNAGVTTLTLNAPPPAARPHLAVYGLQVNDANHNGCAEAGEPLRLRLLFHNRASASAQRITFTNLHARWGAQSQPLPPPVFITAGLAPNDSGHADFEFVIAGNDLSATVLRISGEITAENFCAAALDSSLLHLRFCPLPNVVFKTVTLTDAPGNRDGLASEAELLEALVVCQNESPLTADSVTLTLHFAPPHLELLASRPALALPLPLRHRRALAAGQQDSVRLRLRYADFAPAEAVVALTATLALSAFTPPASAQAVLAIKQECYARPNPFIPARHPEGVRFAPNDGQQVEVFDLHGNRRRVLTTRGRWDGRDDAGRECEPGLYIWSVAGSCRGTIVLVR